VLVVEDDPRVGTMVREYLNGAGFDCAWVVSDRWAYDRLQAAAPFAGLVLDINLGEGTTGFDIARFAREISAATAVVYISGEADLASCTAFGVPDSRFLPKPFDLEALAATLDELIVAQVPPPSGGGSSRGAGRH
jgi:DNA-binding response OmpR family regulator